MDWVSFSVFSSRIYLFSDEGYVNFAKWAVQFPLKFSMYYTVPDCRRERFVLIRRAFSLLLVFHTNDKKLNIAELSAILDSNRIFFYKTLYSLQDKKITIEHGIKLTADQYCKHNMDKLLAK